MLRSLSISNFAIIDQVNIDFDSGMTVLSGETGAGKSIIIDALSLLVGGRGSTDFIRRGTDSLRVEGLFSFDQVDSGLVKVLEDLGLDIQVPAEDLIIHREINLQGKNIIRINGHLANVKLLKSIGNYLADIHGQNEHQLLLDNRNHLGLLDQYGGPDHQVLISTYQEAYQSYQVLLKEWFQANQEEEDQAQRLAYLEFQLAELTKADFHLEEEAELEGLSKQAQNQEQVLNHLNRLNHLISESDHNLLSGLDLLMEDLNHLSDIDQAYEQMSDRLSQIRYELEDIGHQVARDLSSSQLDDINIDEIEGRLALIGQFKRKYKMTLAELIDFQVELQAEIDKIYHRDLYLDKLAKQVLPAYQEVLKRGQILSRNRQDLAQSLKEEVERHLKDLYMGQSQFSVAFQELGRDQALEASFNQDHEFLKLGPMGLDQAEFMIATNLGEDQKPLVKVASGGELSRFMLALKLVFSKHAAPMVMVFDEIDTGVSGRVAVAIAKKMHQVGGTHQVLAITHLPQVAAISDQQLLIQKRNKDQRTYTEVEDLDVAERYQVIGQMLAGGQVSQTSLDLVKKMMTDLRKSVEGVSED